MVFQQEAGMLLLEHKYLFKNTTKERSSFTSSEGIPLSLSILTYLPVVPSRVGELESFSTSAGKSIVRPLHHEDLYSGLQ